VSKRAVELRDELVDRYANSDAARLQTWNHARVVIEALTTACERIAKLEATLVKVRRQIHRGELSQARWVIYKALGGRQELKAEEVDGGHQLP